MPQQTGRAVDRRHFLRTGLLSTGALGLGSLPAVATSNHRVNNCIILFLTGGPSQIDTWDPKPDAPDTVRGPFRPIVTRTPGIHVAETFPLLAERMNRVAILRTVHHDAAPVHETGQQLLQTGRLSTATVEQPNIGSVVHHLAGAGHLLLPGPIVNTGISVGHGQSAGYLGSRHEPRSKSSDLARESSKLRERYGHHDVGRHCLQARRCIEAGNRVVTVNMFDTVFGNTTWDCHADGGSLNASLHDYRDTLCPQLDQAYTALIDDLADRDLLDSTLVVAMGEFGRTPTLNPRGGRDHWTGAWSILMAGGGIHGGQAIGTTDKHGAHPADRPITCAEVAASIYHGMGIDPATAMPTPEGGGRPLVEALPVRELFA